MALVSADVRVTGSETEVREFMAVLATIDLLCGSGSSRRVVIDVDGDGSGNLSFVLIRPDGNYEPISFPEGHAMYGVVWSGVDPLPALSIGE